MKKMWIFVVLLWLVLFPLVWWESHDRVVTTLSSGLTVDLPTSSQAAIEDLESLLQPDFGITHLYIKYGLSRGFYVVYPGTAVLTLTAPWRWERLRYPLLQRLSRELDKRQFNPAPVIDGIVVNAAQVWVSFDEDRCSIDHLLTVTNTSEQALEEITLPLPARNWFVHSHSGEPLDHANADGLLKIFLATVLEPGESSQVLITLETKVTRHAGLELAEAVIIQPAGMQVQVSITSQFGKQYFNLYEPSSGYWLFLLPRPQDLSSSAGVNPA